MGYHLSIIDMCDLCDKFTDPCILLQTQSYEQIQKRPNLVDNPPALSYHCWVCSDIVNRQLVRTVLACVTK